MGKARHKALESKSVGPAQTSFQPAKLIALVLAAVAVGAFLDTIVRSGIFGFGRRSRSLAGKSFPHDLPSDLRRDLEVKPGYD